MHLILPQYQLKVGGDLVTYLQNHTAGSHQLHYNQGAMNYDSTRIRMAELIPARYLDYMKVRFMDYISIAY
jgi:hypothetical protein